MQVIKKLVLTNGDLLNSNSHMEIRKAEGGFETWDYPIVGYDKETNTPSYDKKAKVAIQFIPLHTVHRAIYAVPT